MVKHLDPKLQSGGNSSFPKFGFLTIVLGCFCVLLIITVYVWIISAGSFTEWRTPSAYYYRLAQSFDNGRLYLQENIDSRLLTLTDPYESTDFRNSIPFPWDASFYNGKFYLYWGPAPALILSLIIPFYAGQIGDHYVLFGFLVGLLFFNILILKSVWEDFFKTLPAWMFLVCILLVGLVNPIPWILNRHAVYEAAVAGGQFFFVGGLYWVYSAFRRPLLSRWRLVTAGVFWTLAFGSRMVLILPIAFMVCLTWLGIIWTRGKTSSATQSFLSCAAIGLPILLGGIATGWYNWSRFGSIFEFGLRYQLNDTNLNKYFGDVFSGSYIYSNFYNYMFARSFKISGIFPFIKARAGKSLLGNGVAHQGIYQVHGIEGLLIVFPFVIFAIIPALIMVITLIRRRRKHQDSLDIDHFPPIYVFGLVIGSILGFLPALFFFWVDMRYMFDFVPELVLLAILGFWQSYLYLSRRPVIRSLVLVFGLGLASFSVLISVLLAAPRP